MLITEAIKMRSSCRTFDSCLLSQDHETALKEFIFTPCLGPFGGQVRFFWVENGRQGKIGTYGTIKGAQHFIGGIIASNHLEDYGFLFERIILKATELGLGTCWLGGSFHKSDFARYMVTSADEIIPAVSPVGYSAKRRGLTDRIIRWSAASHCRKNWQELFFNELQPMSEDLSDPYYWPLAMMRLSPSASNKQPWRIIRDSKGLHFFCAVAVNYNKVLKYLRLAELQRIDMGIAMCHFELTARERQLQGRWDVVPISYDVDWKYIVSWIPE